MIPVQKLRGVGPALAKVLAANGIRTAEDLLALEETRLREIPAIGANRAKNLRATAKAAVKEAKPEAKPEAAATDASTEQGAVNGKPANRIEVSFADRFAA